MKPVRSAKRLEVRLLQNPNGTIFFQVRLRSRMNPTMISVAEVTPKGSDSPAEVLKLIQTSAAALAVRQNTNCSDNHTPAEVHQTSGELFAEVCGRYAEQKPELIARAKQLSHSITARELNLGSSISASDD